MFIELLTAIGIGTAALPSDASEPTPIIDYPDPTEVMCLAENMYHEAKNQGTAGWRAVASVTFNRIRCQFSWYCDGKSDEIPSFDGDIFQLIYEYAELYLRPDVILIDITDGATHYHADYVFPEWRKSKTKTVEIGDHIFYRWEK